MTKSRSLHRVILWPNHTKLFTEIHQIHIRTVLWTFKISFKISLTFNGNTALVIKCSSTLHHCYVGFCWLEYSNMQNRSKHAAPDSKYHRCICCYAEGLPLSTMAISYIYIYFLMSFDHFCSGVSQQNNFTWVFSYSQYTHIHTWQ